MYPTFTFPNDSQMTGKLNTSKPIKYQHKQIVRKGLGLTYIGYGSCALHYLSMPSTNVPSVIKFSSFDLELYTPYTHIPTNLLYFVRCICHYTHIPTHLLYFVRCICHYTHIPTNVLYFVRCICDFNPFAYIHDINVCIVWKFSVVATIIAVVHS